MFKQIHLHHQVNRQLEAIEKQDNAHALASGRARKIIDALIQGTPLSMAGLLKPRTDRRMKDSLKFNLGSGFRLICVQNKEAIHVMFFGDHDSCDTWLTHHGRKKPYKNGQVRIIFKKNTPASAFRCLSGKKERSSEKSYLPKISQKDLRIVFKGLLG